MTTTPNPPNSSTPHSGARVVAIVAICIGALIAAVSVTSAVRATAAVTVAGGDAATSVDAAGATALTAELSAGTLTVHFGDVAEAELDVSDASDPTGWRLDRVGDTMKVTSPRHGFGWHPSVRWPDWIGNLFDGPSDLRAEAGRAVLTLPKDLRKLDGTFDLSAGDLRVDGDFDDVALTVDAGQARVAGTARTLHTELNAGRAQVDLRDVTTADVEVSAGKFDGALSGAQPDSVSLTTTAGSLELAVPDGVYAVTDDVTLGHFANRVGSTPGASSHIDVEVTAGQTILRTTSLR